MLQACLLFTAFIPAQRTPPVYTAALSPDGKVLATTFAFIDSPGDVTIRDAATAKERFVCKGHTDAVNAMTFSADGKMVATGDWRGVVKIWDPATGKELASFQHAPQQVWSLAFSPCGRMLASSSPTRIMLWELATGKRRAVIKTKGKESSTFGQHSGCPINFSPDGRTLVLGTQFGGVRRWDALTGEELSPLEGHSDAVIAAVFSPDGQTLATASRDRTVRIWNVAMGRNKGILAGHKGTVVSLAYSPDSRSLVSWCAWHKEVVDKPGPTMVITDVYGTEVKVWEVATGKARLTFEPDEAMTGWLRPVYAVRFNADGTHLRAVDRDNRSTVDWDLVTLAKKAN